MSTKIKMLIVVVSIGTAFAIGRYTVPEKVRVETKIVEVEKKVEDKKENTHKQTHTITTVKPDGTKVTDETTKEDDIIDDKDTDVVSKNTDTTTETTRGASKVTISALGALNLTNSTPAYGLSITKPILGPITVGLFGLNNGTVGASIGLTF